MNAKCATEICFVSQTWLDAKLLLTLRHGPVLVSLALGMQIVYAFVLFVRLLRVTPIVECFKPR